MDQNEARPTTLGVPMLDSEVVKQLKALTALRWGRKRIARELGISPNSVLRYQRGGDAAVVQQRPRARRMTAAELARAIELLDGAARGNAVVVHRLLASEGVRVSLRTLQRRLHPHRQAKRAAELATVRFETAPAEQMQIDFGERVMPIANEPTKVHFFVAVLGYSRRIYVRASLSQRQDDWREGLAGAFRMFGGVPQSILIDRAGALVIGQERDSGAARVHPAFAAFCRDWGVDVTACRPYRARTKGKTESGVGYVKRNAFDSFAALDAHLTQWMVTADRRVHGTTHERPIDRFERDERAALRPLPHARIVVRERRLRRRVANDCFVDVDTIRYSVPHRYVRTSVDVLIGETEVAIFDGRVVIARHRRHHEPHQRVADPSHFDGLYRRGDDRLSAAAPLGRSLDVYAACLGGDA